MRKKLYLLAGVLAATLAALPWLAPGSRAPADGPATAQAVRGETRKRDTSAAPALPPRVGLERQAGQPFRALSWDAPVSKSAAKAAAAPQRPVAPYRVAGTVTYQAEPEVVLVKGNSVVIVREGDTLEDGYRVDAVRPDHVSLLYVPSGDVDRLPLATGVDILAGLQAGPSAAAGSTASSSGAAASTRVTPPPPPPLPPLSR